MESLQIENLNEQKYCEVINLDDTKSDIENQNDQNDRSFQISWIVGINPVNPSFLSQIFLIYSKLKNLNWKADQLKQWNQNLKQFLIQFFEHDSDQFIVFTEELIKVLAGLYPSTPTAQFKIFLPFLELIKEKYQQKNTLGFLILMEFQKFHFYHQNKQRRQMLQFLSPYFPSENLNKQRYFFNALEIDPSIPKKNTSGFLGQYLNQMNQDEKLPLSKFTQIYPYCTLVYSDLDYFKTLNKKYFQLLSKKRLLSKKKILKQKKTFWTPQKKKKDSMLKQETPYFPQYNKVSFILKNDAKIFEKNVKLAQINQTVQKIHQFF